MIAYEFLFVFHCNYGHILYRFGDKGRYLSKIAILSHYPSTNTSWGKTLVNIFALFYVIRSWRALIQTGRRQCDQYLALFRKRYKIRPQLQWITN